MTALFSIPETLHEGFDDVFGAIRGTKEDAYAYLARTTRVEISATGLLVALVKNDAPSRKDILELSLGYLRSAAKTEVDYWALYDETLQGLLFFEKSAQTIQDIWRKMNSTNESNSEVIYEPKCDLQWREHAAAMLALKPGMPTSVDEGVTLAASAWKKLLAETTVGMMAHCPNSDLRRLSGQEGDAIEAIVGKGNMKRAAQAHIIAPVVQEWVNTVWEDDAKCYAFPKRRFGQALLDGLA